MAETILQHWIFTRFALPFLLVFFVTFAILEKGKVLGDKKQINALVAFVIGLIFVSFVFPVIVVQNLILFLTVALIAMFVGLILWGFVGGKIELGEMKIVKYILGIGIALLVIVAVLWATGFYTPILDWFSLQEWSSGFWTNLLFIVAIIVAVTVALKAGAGGSGSG